MRNERERVRVDREKRKHNAFHERHERERAKRVRQKRDRKKTGWRLGRI